jgi:hypothetical protein
MIASSPTKVLSPEIVAHYHREGYALPRRQLLPAGDFAALRECFERLQAEWLRHGGRPEHMDVPHFYFPELNRFLLHPQVLDTVEDLIGPDFALFSSHFICKPPGNGKRVPWHEDSAYWRRLFTPGPGMDGDGMEVVTIWLGVDASDLGNGCMHVIPGSHANGYSEYDLIPDENAVFEGNIKAGSFDESRAVPCILRQGEYSLHHAKTIHGSAANTSNRRRCGYTMRYITTRARFHQERSHGGKHQLYLARGVDHAGNAYGDPARPNQAWIDAHGFFIPKGH